MDKRRRAEAVYASRAASKKSFTPEESEKPVEVKKKTYEDPVLDLRVKIQYLDDAIAHIQTKLEKQAIRLEAMVRHQEMQLCKALDERCNVIEERLHETLTAQSRRIFLDGVHKQRSANLAGQSDASNVVQSANFKCSNAPLMGIGCDNKKVPRIAEDTIECETTKTLFGSAVPSFASSDPVPTRENSTISFSADESIAVWHPFSDQEPRNIELRPNLENRQSRHLREQHLGRTIRGGTTIFTRV